MILSIFIYEIEMSEGWPEGKADVSPRRRTPKVKLYNVIFWVHPEK
jgi:hypothetical protein